MVCPCSEEFYVWPKRRTVAYNPIQAAYIQNLRTYMLPTQTKLCSAAMKIIISWKTYGYLQLHNINLEFYILWLSNLILRFCSLGPSIDNDSCCQNIYTQVSNNTFLPQTNISPQSCTQLEISCKLIKISHWWNTSQRQKKSILQERRQNTSSSPFSQIQTIEKERSTRICTARSPVHTIYTTTFIWI